MTQFRGGPPVDVSVVGPENSKSAYLLKIFLEYQKGTTTMRYAPPAGSASKEPINEGSLSKIVNKPWTWEADQAIAETQK